MTVQLDPPGTSHFISTCETAATSVTDTFDLAKRLHGNMQLGVAPVVSVNFDQLEATGDDYDDVAYLARTLWLDATGADNKGLGSYDGSSLWTGPVTDTLNTADNLMEGGEDGRNLRDARNSGVSTLALRAAIAAGADIEVTDDGLIVVQTNGIDLDVPILKDDDGNPLNVQIPLSARGGTTYGNVFITKAGSIDMDANDVPNDPDAQVAQDRKDLLEHEKRHTYQWAAAGAFTYPILYGKEEAERLIPKKVDVDWDWKNPLDIDVDLEWHGEGCTNDFERHAGYEDGGYDCDE